MVLLPLVALIGFLVGSAGVGGILVVPLLISVADVPIQIAIATAMCSYIFVGIVSSWIYARHKNVPWINALWMGIGAVPGALIGTLLLSYLPTAFIAMVVAGVVLLAGLRAATAGKSELAEVSTAVPVLPTSSRFAIGLGVGSLSALSGAGGPLLLLPILFFLKWPIRSALGLAQVIQIPIALTATLGNLVFSTLDIGLAIIVAVAMVIGAAAGSYAGHSLPVVLLRKVVAMLLVGTALWMVFDLLFIA